MEGMEQRKEEEKDRDNEENINSCVYRKDQNVGLITTNIVVFPAKS